MKPWLLIGLCVLAACAKGPQESASPEAPEGSMLVDLRSEPFKREARRWIVDVRRAHAEADRSEQAGDLDAAFALLKSALERPVPIAVRSWHKAALRRDLYGHAARLALALERTEEASQLIALGLAIDDAAEDPFRTQLLFLAVDVAEAKNDLEGGVKARRELRAALEPAMK